MKEMLNAQKIIIKHKKIIANIAGNNSRFYHRRYIFFKRYNVNNIY